MTSSSQHRPLKVGVVPWMAEGSLNGRTPRFVDIEEMALTAEAIGLDSFWLADHLIYRGPDGVKIGAWEAFTFLSGIAAATSRIALGPLVACTSFRNPALLAKMADSLDEISSGRFILGLGAGWHQPEYEAFGYPFDYRVGRFEEAVNIIAPLLRQGRVDFHGRFYDAAECVLRPRGPSPTGPPIWVGAKCERMFRIAAEHADAVNIVWPVDQKSVIEWREKVLAACEAVGRDPDSLRLTAGTHIHLPEAGRPAQDDRAICGTYEEIANTLQEFAEAGVSHVNVILDRVTSGETIEEFARAVEILDEG